MGDRFVLPSTDMTKLICMVKMLPYEFVGGGQCSCAADRLGAHSTLFGCGAVLPHVPALCQTALLFHELS